MNPRPVFFLSPTRFFTIPNPGFSHPQPGFFSIPNLTLGRADFFFVLRGVYPQPVFFALDSSGYVPVPALAHGKKKNQCSTGSKKKSSASTTYGYLNPTHDWFFLDRPPPSFFCTGSENTPRQNLTPARVISTRTSVNTGYFYLYLPYLHKYPVDFFFFSYQ